MDDTRKEILKLEVINFVQEVIERNFAEFVEQKKITDEELKWLRSLEEHKIPQFAVECINWHIVFSKKGS